jgi:AbrB family looped-hinge helix DNA binding protein
MAAKALVAMNEQGRVTIPAAARRALRLRGEAQFEYEVVDNTIVLRPVVAIPAEDAWAYTPKMRENLRRAQEDARAGRVYRVTKEFMEQVLETAALADREGRELTYDDAVAMLEAAERAGTVERVGEAVAPRESGRADEADRAAQARV